MIDKNTHVTMSADTLAKMLAYQYNKGMVYEEIGWTSMDEWKANNIALEYAKENWKAFLPEVETMLETVQ